MPIDEAIKHYEEMAEEQERDFKECPYPSAECDGWTHCKALQNGYNKGCLKCASEHRQLAEWLRELKGLREQHKDKNRFKQIIIKINSEEPSSFYAIVDTKTNQVYAQYYDLASIQEMCYFTIEELKADDR